MGLFGRHREKPARKNAGRRCFYDRQQAYALAGGSPPYAFLGARLPNPELTIDFDLDDYSNCYSQQIHNESHLSSGPSTPAEIEQQPRHNAMRSPISQPLQQTRRYDQLFSAQSLRSRDHMNT